MSVDLCLGILLANPRLRDAIIQALPVPLFGLDPYAALHAAYEGFGDRPVIISALITRWDVRNNRNDLVPSGRRWAWVLVQRG